MDWCMYGACMVHRACLLHPCCMDVALEFMDWAEAADPVISLAEDIVMAEREHACFL